MENSSDDDDCCVICSKTRNDSSLLLLEAKNTDDFNKNLSKVYNIEIVRTGSRDLRICASCSFTVVKAAKLKDFLQNRETLFKPTREKVQEPNQDPGGLTITNTKEISANQSPGCLKTTQSQLMCVEIGSTAECKKQHAGVEIAQNDSHLEVPNKNDRLKRGRADDDKPVSVPTEENIEDDLEGSPEKLSKVNEDNDIEMMTIAEDDTSSSVTAELNGEHGEHAPEIELGKANALDDCVKIHQGRKLCKRAILKVRNASLDQPKKSLSDLYSHAGEKLRRRSLPSNLKSEAKVQCDPAMLDDDTSLDYVADSGDSVAGASTSRLSMLTRSRRSQMESNMGCTADPPPHRRQICDKFYECDHCSKAFDMKRGILTHMRIHIRCTDKLKARKPTIKPGPRFTSVKQQQKSGCASTDTAMNVSTVLTSKSRRKSEGIQSMSSLSMASQASKSRRKSQGSFMCCKKDFATSENKRKHLETAHADRKQVCVVCDKVFHQNFQFERHMKDHDNIRQFRCTFEGCIKSYDSCKGLAAHKRQIHADYRLKCFCGFRALSKPALMKHETNCSVGNSQKIELKKLVEGPSSAEQKVPAKAERKVELPQFGCDYQGCDESFVTSAELNQHALGHAENSDRVESLPTSTVRAPRPFECGCGYKTQDFDEFKKHFPCPL